MHIKNKYINAIIDAMDFISQNTDGASEEHQEKETLTVLQEIITKMEESEHKRLVRYYVRKGSKKR